MVFWLPIGKPLYILRSMHPSSTPRMSSRDYFRITYGSILRGTWKPLPVFLCRKEKINLQRQSLPKPRSLVSVFGVLVTAAFSFNVRHTDMKHALGSLKRKRKLEKNFRQILNRPGTVRFPTSGCFVLLTESWAAVCSRRYRISSRTKRAGHRAK